ncbi:hypothetical protein, partial [Amycolatopsis anabasis]|uniref:hypothetical protein n=1 Tax=Amycolatopsis anabasis TaxID=1840409 RepID=UPI00131BD799
LPATLVFDYPNSQAITDHIMGELAPAEPETNGHDPSDDQIRRALQAIPIDRLRDAGLMDSLLELAGLRTPQENGNGHDSIDAMDTDALIDLAMGGGDLNDGGAGD